MASWRRMEADRPRRAAGNQYRTKGRLQRRAPQGRSSEVAEVVDSLTSLFKLNDATFQTSFPHFGKPNQSFEKT